MPRPYFESDIKEIIEKLGPSVQLFSGKTVVLTGSEGFLGLYFSAMFQMLSDTVLEQPVKVLAFDNFVSSAVSKQEMPEYSCIAFQDHNIIMPIPVAEKVDFVIHLAGIASPVWYRLKPLETLDVATTGTRNALDLAKANDARMLHFSSSEIYGDPSTHHVPTSENYHGNVSCRGPRACYDEGKRMGETLCDIYHDHFGVDVIVVRPFNVYGPGLGERDYRVLPTFASRLKSGTPLQVYGSGKQTRTFCYIVDAIYGFTQALLSGAPGEAYNIGNPNPEVSIAELAHTVNKLTDIPVHIIDDYPDGYPSNEPQRRCPDISKAHLHFEFKPTISLKEGLVRFFRWTDQAYDGTGDLAGALGKD